MNPNDRCYGCGQVHDYSQSYYLVCYECGHVWRTEEELVADHTALLAEMKAPIHPDDHRAEKIYICPQCTHDF